jgi:pyruvate, orthophosphate dikinase
MMSVSQAAAKQWVYGFGGGKADGDAAMKNLLGGKGAGLAEMSNIGLPVPPGFTITTEVCVWYYDHDKTYPSDLTPQVMTALAAVETYLGMKFGDADNPLLVSVRSGARVSMPGMMDTVLNLGLNKITVEGLARRSGDPRFAYDSYRRFIQMFSSVVLGVQHHKFEDVLADIKRSHRVKTDADLTPQALSEVIEAYLELVKKQTGQDFPQDVGQQLWGAIGAVFSSWMNPRAVTYRRLHDFPQDWGTAVNVQAMVFGNQGEDCCTGVAFTRNPSTGENAFYGEYLVNAQGEDVVAGIRTPQQITIKGKLEQQDDQPAMEETMPAVFAQLNQVRQVLERHYRDMQDIEFTVQQGKLYMLQTRSGKRTAAAALRIAVEMVREGLIDRDTALLRLEPQALNQLLHPTLDPNAKRIVLTKGLPASPGAASGRIVLTADKAEAWAKRGEAVILCRIETSPEDIHGMHAARAILTARGGMTSHAAVVARGMGRVCVSGASAVQIDFKANTMTVGDKVFAEGDALTLDGSTGEVMLGLMPTIEPVLSSDFAEVMGWADQVRKLRIRTNAETPLDARVARQFGAEGIGLCRTEHMFFDAERITAMREMIVAKTTEGRLAALAKLEPMQRQDFIELFTIMAGLPVTIRLLDPPLHEFLPQAESEIAAVATAAGITVSEVKSRMAALHESNPMLGHRGCRLGISYPEIYAMQARAILTAALSVRQKTGTSVTPEIMIPLVATKKELDILKAVIDAEAQKIMQASAMRIDYQIGTMIELPRAALRAAEIALTAEFFSFGTNDLTQTSFGLSRDDAASFLEDYQRQGIFPHDPFVTLDQDGVGELIALAVARGKFARADLKLGICGEHGGDPASIRFCHQTGLDYVSCSPYRVPIARLAAAQAALAEKHKAEQKRSAA